MSDNPFADLVPKQTQAKQNPFTDLVPKQKVAEDNPFQHLVPKQSFAEAAIAPIKDIPKEYQKEVGEGISAMKEGVKDIASGHPFKGAGKAALGALDYAVAPINAPVHSIVGKPVEKATGIPAEYTDMAAQVFLPSGLEKMGAKSLGEIAVPGSEKVPENFEPKKAASVVESIFSPTTVSKAAGNTEAEIRKNIGQAERDTSVTKNNLDQYQKQINSLPQEDKLGFIDYVEGRSKNAVLKNKELQPVADSLKNAFEERKAKIEALPEGDRAGFIEDYFPHIWKNPGAAQEFVAGFGKQGSGKNLKARSIPTIADGIKAGLVPAYDNPLDAAMQYTANMDRYIASNKILSNLKDNGSVKYFTPGKQPSGWEPIKGRLANKLAVYKEGEEAKAIPKQAYAPKDVANVYNNYISRGFAEIGPNAGKVYENTQKLLNSVTMAELGLSFFHASTMAMESMISGVANAIGKGAKGDIVGGVKKAAESIGPWKPALNYRTGKKFEQQYLGTRDHGPDFRNIVDLGTRAGMRAVGKDKTMKASAMGSFWDSWKKGTLKAEAAAAGKDIKDAPVLGTANTFARTMGRIMDTVAQPLFEKVIPRLKNGAFYETMESWIQQHPGSSKEEQLAAARQIWDSVDNRFGELVQDNLFWNKMLKQSLQLMVRSTGWDLGTLREIGGGVKDLGQTIAKGKELSPRAQYTLALPIVTGLYNAAAQYLKTGKSPEKLEDLYAYQTGGKNPDGTPERAMIPGYMKDVVGYLHNPMDEAEGKIASGPKDIYGLLTNQNMQMPPNFYGQRYPIAEGSDIPGFVKGYVKFIADSYTPISIKNLKQGEKVGSNITPAERTLAIRPAPFYLQNPEKAKQLDEIKRTKLEQGKNRYEQKQKAIYGGPQ